jgi:hypothetical protein
VEVFNGQDDDCDGQVDEGLGLFDLDGDGFNDDVDCNDQDPSIFPGAFENCNGLDDDCNAIVDEGFNLNTDAQNCGDCGIQCPPGSSCVNGNCMAADADGDGFGADVDCDDVNASIFPGALEFCDGVDNDCDGLVDNGFNLNTDAQNCGDCGIQCPIGTSCVNGFCMVSDADGDGFGSDVDCDDFNASVNPNAVEVCDGVDNDCDGQVDEGCVCPPAGTPCDDGNACTVGEVQDGACNCISGMFLPAGSTAASQVAGDCQMLVCDGMGGITSVVDNADVPVDGNDCTFDVCVAGMPTSTPSPSGTPCLSGTCDGTGTCVQTCTDNDLDSFTTCAGDCDDTNPMIFPGATEICDGIDNDCDTQVDEGNPGGGGPCSTGAPGQCGAGTIVCQFGTLACVANAPPSAEVCDGIDNDCDGIVDENACVIPNANSACVSGQCVIISCLPGFFDCDGNAGNGCEHFGTCP